jgi:branched-chain amino acid transport system substrate-binding protein
MKQLLGVLLLSSLFAPAWAETPATSAPQQQASAKDNLEYKAIYQLYSTGEYDSALKRMSSFERLYPTSKILASIENLHGMTFLLLKQPAQAIPHFKRAVDISKAQPSFSQYVDYNLATAQFEAGQFDDAQDTLTDLHSDSLDRDTRIKVHYLKARLFEKHSLPTEAAQECLTGSRLFTSAEAQDNRASGSSLGTFLDTVLGEITSLSQIEDLYKNFEDAPIADLLLYRMGSLELKQGDRDKALASFKLLTTKFPQSPKMPMATQVLMADQNTGPVEKTTIGVLLPLKGRFQRFGSRALQAIDLAFGVFGEQSEENKKSKVTLVMEDSGEDTDQTVSALERLVNQHHVIAVIGPLLSKGIDQVTQRAQELGVPLISLARTSSAATSGNYVFQAGITLQMQAEQIARYATQKLGFKKFAEVYPKEKVGIESSNFFWDAVDGMGAEVVGAESYVPDETDFRQVVDKLSGLYYTEARQKELDDLAKSRELNNIRKRTRKTEQYFSLKPIVDYQAVFIPEEAKATGQILPTFAYRDVEKVRFLGTAAWNSPELATRAQNYAEGVLFTDAFFAGSEFPPSRKFFDAYRATYGAEPTSMEAIAYDAARILDQSIAGGSETRAAVRDNLQAIKNFTGVTGNLSYTNGLFSRDLKILTIHGGKIVLAD